MYGKIIDGNLEIFNGHILNYTTEEDGVKYYVTSVNPSEKEFNAAGYYRISPDVESKVYENAEFEVTDNIICIKSTTNEKASVQ